MLGLLLRRKHRPSGHDCFVAETNHVFDGRRHGPIRAGSWNSINPALWIFADHVEYVAGFKVARLERSAIDAVDVKKSLFGGVLVLQKAGGSSVVECGFRTKQRLRDTLSVLKAHGFAFTDGAVDVLHE